MIERTTLELADGRQLDCFLADGDGTPIVYHHGTPSSAMPPYGWADAFAERSLRFVAWSRPGYADSTRHEGRSVASVADDVRQVLDQLGIDRAYTIGWSGGGPHATATTALLPDRIVGGASIAGVAPYPAAGIDWYAGMGPENVEEFGAALESPEALAAFLDRFYPAFNQVTADEIADSFGGLIDHVDRGSLTGEFAENMAATTRDGLRNGYWGWFDDDIAFTRDWGFEMGAIAVPFHVWQGSHDRMVPYAHGRWLADHVGSSCIHLHPDEGHLTLAVDAIGRILDELVGG
ncbi:MAG TPA: alpha/beta hydrolase [Candidatus Limnocylindria bacterium]|jgi:pimeloyl-ACP methyl ester carboxylesterase